MYHKDSLVNNVRFFPPKNFNNFYKIIFVSELSSRIEVLIWEVFCYVKLIILELGLVASSKMFQNHFDLFFIIIYHRISTLRFCNCLSLHFDGVKKFLKHQLTIKVMMLLLKYNMLLKSQCNYKGKLDFKSFVVYFYFIFLLFILIL